jgi:hypothetical protein
VEASIFPFKRSSDLAYPDIFIYLITCPSLLTLIHSSLDPEESNFPEAYARPITDP